MLLSRVERNDLISSARYQEKCPSNLFPEPEAVSLQGWSWWVGWGEVASTQLEALRAWTGNGLAQFAILGEANFSRLPTDMRQD